MLAGVQCNKAGIARLETVAAEMVMAWTDSILCVVCPREWRSLISYFGSSIEWVVRNKGSREYILESIVEITRVYDGEP